MADFDFLETLGKEILERIVPQLAAAVVRAAAASIKDEAVFRFSEKEAAEKLGIGQATLAQVRRDKRIEFIYEMRGGRGRIFYLPRHLEEYLARNERLFFRRTNQ